MQTRKNKSLARARKIVFTIVGFALGIYIFKEIKAAGLGAGLGFLVSLIWN